MTDEGHGTENCIASQVVDYWHRTLLEAQESDVRKKTPRIPIPNLGALRHDFSGAGMRVGLARQDPKTQLPEGVIEAINTMLTPPDAAEPGTTSDAPETAAVGPDPDPVATVAATRSTDAPVLVVFARKSAAVARVCCDPSDKSSIEPVFWFEARIDRQGVLHCPEGKTSLPKVPRILMDPQPMFDSDQLRDPIGEFGAWAEQLTVFSDWLDKIDEDVPFSDYASLCINLFENAFGSDELKALKACVVPASGGAATWHLRKAYEKLIAGRRSPLLEKLLAPDTSQSSDVPRVSLIMVAKAGKSADPLNSDQRRALHCLEAMGSNPGLIAVTGPPGTGKTAMLRAMIATRWAKSAVLPTDGSPPAPCPVTVACGATNQSVENVMGTFAGVFGVERTLTRRWLKTKEGKTVDAYSASIPSKTRLADHKKAGYAILNRHEKDSDGRKELKLDGAAATFWDEIGNPKVFLKYHNQIPLARAWVFDLHKTLQKEREYGGLLRRLVTDAMVTTLRKCEESFKHRKAELDEVYAKRKAGQPKTPNEIVPNCAKYLLISARVLSGLLNTGIEGQASQLDALTSAARDKGQDGVLEWLEKNDMNDHVEAVRKALDRAGAATPVEMAELVLDIAVRADLFHLAARLWEARWILARLGHPVSEADGDDFSRLAMLFPCLVSTLHSVPALFDLNRIDLLIVDEAGQAAPELGGAAFALAKQAVVVGDSKQLAPVTQIPPEVDARQMLDRYDPAKVDAWRRRGLDVANGSVMRLAMTGATFSDPKRQGLLLRRHYRCARSIINYCIDLLYHDHDFQDGEVTALELQPQIEDPKRGAWADAWDETKDRPYFQQHFPLPPLGFFQTGSASDEPSKQDSWQNSGEAEALVEWLERHAEALALWISRAEGREVDISEAVAIVTPFRGQADRIRELIEKKLDGQKRFKDPVDRKLSERLIVGTVHKLQGAERPVVLFSGVNKDCSATSKDAKPSEMVFLDRDGGNLLNVAVSRAQKSFILFGHADLFFSAKALALSNDLPTAMLGRHMAGVKRQDPKIGIELTGGRRIGPDCLVAVESQVKAKVIQSFLGRLDYQVFATDGHFRDLGGLGQLSSTTDFSFEWKLRTAASAGGDLERDTLPTTQMLQSVATRLIQTRRLVIATDADAQGEAIAWHLLQVLQKSPYWTHVEEVVRVRFSEITEPAIKAAFANPDKVVRLAADAPAESVLDQRLAAAALAQAVFDNHVGSLYVQNGAGGGGRVQGALLRLLEATLPERPGAAAEQTVEIEASLGDRRVPATLLRRDSVHWTGTPQEADEIRARLATARLAEIERRPITREVAASDKFGTVTALIAASRRLKYSPAVTMAALQELYEHKPSGDDGGSPTDPLPQDLSLDALDPTVPQASRQALAEADEKGIVRLTAEGLALAARIRENDLLDRLATTATTARVERDLKAKSFGSQGVSETYKEILAGWLADLTGAKTAPGDLPDPAGHDTSAALFEAFPPDMVQHPAWDAAIEAPPAASLPPDGPRTSDRGAGAHSALVPLNLDVGPEHESLKAMSKEAQKIYAMLHAMTLASVVVPARLAGERLLFEVEGLPDIAVAIDYLKIVEDGWLEVDPEGRDGLFDDCFEATSWSEGAGAPQLHVLGVRLAGLPSQTVAGLLRFMADHGLGRPSTFATHLTKLMPAGGGDRG